MLIIFIDCHVGVPPRNDDVLCGMKLLLRATARVAPTRNDEIC